MRLIKVGNKEYQLEFTFEAAECRELVQKMFNVMSMSYLYKDMNADELDGESNKKMKIGVLFNGASEMVADIPHICYIAFYAGLLENNPVSEEESRKLMKDYMKENKLSFAALFENLKKYMEEDGFFDLSGLNKMLADMNVAEETKKAPKAPQDHKKSTSTK